MAETKKATGEWESGRHRVSRSNWGGWWSFPFGLIGPLIGAAVGLLLIVIALWALKILNAAVQSQFIDLLIAAVAANIWVFFAFSLVMGYLDFLIRRSGLAYAILMPVSSAASITFAAWIISWVFRTIGNLAAVPFLAQLGTLLRGNLLLVFIMFLLLGYLTMWLMRRR